MTITQTRPYAEMRSSQPFDPSDRSRFGQLQETAKDCFIKELTDFFDYTRSDGLSKIEEIPNIQKFSFGGNEGLSGLETVVNIITAYGDTLDKFPMISITSSSYRERVMGIGGTYVSQVQYPPFIAGTGTGPFNLSALIAPLNIQIKTTPQDLYTQYSTITLDPSLFVDFSSVSVSDIVRVVNKTQALYYTLKESSSGTLEIEAGGPASPSDRNSIEITDGNSQLLSLLGLSIGQSASYTDEDNPILNRYTQAADMVINIDVVGDSINTRAELSDLVSAFFTYYTNKNVYEFFGRSYFDRSVENEWYHISLNNQFSWNGEINKPRQGGEQYEHIYAVRGSVPIFVEDFIDKKTSGEVYIADKSNVTAIPTASGDSLSGDYFGVNYFKL